MLLATSVELKVETENREQNTIESEPPVIKSDIQGPQHVPRPPTRFSTTTTFKAWLCPCPSQAILSVRGTVPHSASSVFLKHSSPSRSISDNSFIGVIL